MFAFDREMPRITLGRHHCRAAGVAFLLCAAAACSSDEPAIGDGNGEGGPVYLVSSSLIIPGGNTGFVSLLSSLQPSEEELALANAYEFPGLGYAWVIGDRVYVSGGDSPTITRYDVSPEGRLVEDETLSFGAFGVTDSAFWNNVVVDENKAYVNVASSQLVVWNPTTMEIEGTVDLPDFEDRNGLRPTLALGDRGAVVFQGRLFLAIYWTGPSFAERDARSQILVYDVEQDALVEVIDAPCPGLDAASLDEDAGRIYFSPWTGGAGAALVLGNAPTCVVEIDPNSLAITNVFDFADLTDGREGAVFQALGEGRFAFSVFHDEEVDLQGAIDDQDPFTILGAEAWRLWTYDADGGVATPIDAVDWNSGAVYWSEVDGVTHALIPTTEFASSIIYELADDGSDAVPRFEYQGFTLRLFRVR